MIEFYRHNWTSIAKQLNKQTGNILNLILSNKLNFILIKLELGLSEIDIFN